MGNELYFSVPWTELSGAISRSLPRRLRKYVRDRYRPDPNNKAIWNIAYRELFALFYGMLLWHEKLGGRWAAPHCDNTVAQFVVNKGSSAVVPFHALIRQMYKFMAHENIRVRIQRVTSEANVLADLCSRGDLDGYRRALATGQYTVLKPEEIWQERTFNNPMLLEQEAHKYDRGTRSGDSTLAENTQEAGLRALLHGIECHETMPDIDGWMFLNGHNTPSLQ